MADVTETLSTNSLAIPLERVRDNLSNSATFKAVLDAQKSGSFTATQLLQYIHYCAIDREENSSDTRYEFPCAVVRFSPSGTGSRQEALNCYIDSNSIELVIYFRESVTDIGGTLFQDFSVWFLNKIGEIKTELQDYEPTSGNKLDMNTIRVRTMFIPGTENEDELEDGGSTVNIWCTILTISSGV